MFPIFDVPYVSSLFVRTRQTTHNQLQPAELSITEVEETENSLNKPRKLRAKLAKYFLVTIIKNIVT